MGDGSTWRRNILQLGIAVVLAVCSAGCQEPLALRLAKEPRAGRALNDAVCVVYSRRYQIRLGGFEKLHSFDIDKYSKIYLGLVADGVLDPADVFVPDEIERADLLRVHSEEYIDRRLKRSRLVARYLEFGLATIAPAGYLDNAVLRPFRYATGGTLLAARLALRHGVVVNLGGGYHHAEPDAGGGFCIYADMPIAIRTLQEEGKIKRALVVDLDVHQGNGTAVCVASDDAVYTFDMHEEGIYPIPKEENDLDVALPAGTDDEEYLATLSEHLSDVFDRARADIVFYQSGVDVLAGDPLAHLRMTIDGVVARDGMVIAEARRRGIPIVMVLGGGYSRDAWMAQYRSIRSIIEAYGAETRDADGAQQVER
jgi:histone deacetylase 11